MNLRTECPKKIGRPVKLSGRSKRNIVRHAVSLQQSPSTIKRTLNVNESVRSVQRVLKNSDHAACMKRKPCTGLTQKHKHIRLDWCKDKIYWTIDDWKKVVFTDEKKFNLDGPDGLQYYWHDLQKQPEIDSKRVQGGRSVMVWGAISFNGKLDLVGNEGKMNSEYYTQVLENVLLPIADTVVGEDWILQQDNAAVHTSRHTTDFLDTYDIDTLTWPAKSPDLNIIENLWGVLARGVYRNGRQFDNVPDLQDAIMDEWNKIKRDYIRKLYKSIQSRLVAVIQNKGGMNSY